MATFKYYTVQGTIDGETESLYGSYDRNDCKYELDAERAGWREEGYTKLTIVATEVEQEADKGVYTTVTCYELYEMHKEDNQAFTAAEWLSDCLQTGYVTKVGVDSYLINNEY